MYQSGSEHSSCLDVCLAQQEGVPRSVRQCNGGKLGSGEAGILVDLGLPVVGQVFMDITSNGLCWGPSDEPIQ